MSENNKNSLMWCRQAWTSQIPVPPKPQDVHACLLYVYFMSTLCLLYVYFVIWSKSSRPPQKNFCTRKTLQPHRRPQRSSRHALISPSFISPTQPSGVPETLDRTDSFFKRQTLGVNPQAALLAAAWKKLRVGGVWWVVCGGVWYVVV